MLWRPYAEPGIETGSALCMLRCLNPYVSSPTPLLYTSLRIIRLTKTKIWHLLIFGVRTGLTLPWAHDLFFWKRDEWFFYMCIASAATSQFGVVTTCTSVTLLQWLTDTTSSNWKTGKGERQNLLFICWAVSLSTPSLLFCKLNALSWFLALFFFPTSFLSNQFSEYFLPANLPTTQFHQIFAYWILEAGQRKCLFLSIN